MGVLQGSQTLFRTSVQQMQSLERKKCTRVCNQTQGTHCSYTLLIFKLLISRWAQSALPQQLWHYSLPLGWPTAVCDSLWLWVTVTLQGMFWISTEVQPCIFSFKPVFYLHAPSLSVYHYHCVHVFSSEKVVSSSYSLLRVCQVLHYSIHLSLSLNQMLCDKCWVSIASFNRCQTTWSM